MEVKPHISFLVCEGGQASAAGVPVGVGVMHMNTTIGELMSESTAGDNFFIGTNNNNNATNSQQNKPRKGSRGSISSTSNISLPPNNAINHSGSSNKLMTPMKKELADVP